MSLFQNPVGFGQALGKTGQTGLRAAILSNPPETTRECSWLLHLLLKGWRGRDIFRKMKYGQ
jgi:hypothetical protein